MNPNVLLLPVQDVYFLMVAGHKCADIVIYAHTLPFVVRCAYRVVWNTPLKFIARRFLKNPFSLYCVQFEVEDDLRRAAGMLRALHQGAPPGSARG